MQRSHDVSRVDAAESAAELAGSETESRTRFTAGGAIPPVLDGMQLAALSPSDRAYGPGPGTGRRSDDRDDDDDGGSDQPLSPEGRIMARVAEQDRAAIEEASRRFGVPEVDILAVITHESRGIATANAGARQRDRGRNAASGLMQVTHETWRHTLTLHPELAQYDFHGHRYNRRANILVGTAALADKRRALERLGVDASGPNGTQLTTMAFNAGEGIVAAAYRSAVNAGSRNPAEDCLKPEHLKPAIARYPSVYSYYLTGGGKSRNPQRTVERAVELKYLEISKYPDKVEMLIAEATEHELVEEDLDMPDPISDGDRTALA